MAGLETAEASATAAGPAIVAEQETVAVLGTVEATALVPEPATEARIAEEAVAVAIVWVTVAYRPGVAAAPEGMPSGVEVARAAAQREPAAHVVPPVWAVAAGVAAVVVGAGGREAMNREIQMRLHKPNLCAKKVLAGLLLSACCCALGLLVSSPSYSQEKAPATPPQQPAQKTFKTPQEASDAFIQATASYDVPALTQILGPLGEDLVSSEDQVRDKNLATEFAAKARDKNSVVIDPKNADRATLVVGNDDWPMPIPLVKRNGVWLFDTKAGRQEVLYRRIGAHELDAIEICRGYVDAQHEYALEKHDGAEVNQYAQRVISTPGKHDGLVWRNPDGTLGGPIAENIADALQQGYTDKSKPYHGYFFKILKGQGPAAPLGRMDFVVEGAMIGGFALAAAPAQYRVTGVKTFIVGYDGVVYQKDLGPDTLKIFQSMELYNPDKTWQPTDDNWPFDPDTASTTASKP